MVASDFSHWHWFKVAIPGLFPPGGQASPPMPSAYTQNFYHIVFSTKHRANLISHCNLT